jgi:hypothetical protein
VWAYILTALRTAVGLSTSDVYPLICPSRKALQVAFLPLALFLGLLAYTNLITKDRREGHPRDALKVWR